MALVIVFCICYNICLVFKCVKELHLVMLGETTGNFDKWKSQKTINLFSIPNEIINGKFYIWNVGLEMKKKIVWKKFW